MYHFKVLRPELLCALYEAEKVQKTGVVGLHVHQVVLLTGFVTHFEDFFKEVLMSKRSSTRYGGLLMRN